MKLGFVEKCIANERKILFLLITTCANVLFILACCNLWNYTGFLFGYDYLSSQEDLAKFRQSQFHISRIYYQSADRLSDFTYTQTVQVTISSFNQGYVEAPVSQSEKIVKCRLYQLKLQDGTSVLIGSETPLPMEHTVFIRNTRTSKKENLEREILSAYPNNSAFFLADNGGVPIGVYLICMMFFLHGLAFFLRRFQWLQSKSHLARQLGKQGNWRICADRLNQQAENPLFISGNTLITPEFIVLYEKNSYSNSRCTLIPVRWIWKIKMLTDGDSASLLLLDESEKEITSLEGFDPVEAEKICQQLLLSRGNL